MKYKRIIGFAGRKRSGKGVLANLLKDEYNGVILTVADYLKYLCCELLNIDYIELNKIKDDGTTFSYFLTDKWTNIIYNRTNISKEDINNTIGSIEFTNVRQMLQVIGTDLIRKFKPNWHVEQLVEDINSYRNDKLIMIDDVRFPNERKAIEMLGGEVYYIIRPNWTEISNHISETSLQWYNFDYKHVVINDRPKIEYETIFKMYFANDFNIKIPNGLLLSDNIQYVNEYNDFITNNSNLTNPLIKESLKLFRNET